MKPGIWERWNDAWPAVAAVIASWAIITAILLALSALWRPAHGQFFDPDWKINPSGSDAWHFAGGAAADQALALVWHKPWQRVAGTAVVGVVFEFGQWDVHRGVCLGQPGCGFGVKDVLVDVSGAVARELLWAGVKATRTRHEPLSKTNVALATSATTLLLLDRGMTEHAIRNGYEELNPILGPHPSVGRINAYTAACVAGELGIGLLLHDTKARNFWWGGVALLELAVIAHNAAIRIPVRF